MTLTVLAFATAVFAQTPVTPNTGTTANTVTNTNVAPDNPNAGDFKFTEETWDFQNIPQNKPVTHDFTFTNTGKEPIVITNCQASCGCTVPKWPKEPILPGKSDVISVTYNAAHAGGFNKSITITSNAKTPTKVIYIKGTVDAAPVEQTTPEQQPNMMQTNPK
ncbi:MAG TPA: DUF1573 domain-containing protein [Bacteroidetes bacterium]|nr:DUF1573 domain-containing protein [Bacteroidota bacterium]